MIGYIKGRLVNKGINDVTVESGGIGYEITVPGNSAVYLADIGNEITVYTYLAVREDDISLYGFSDKDELKLFKQLITVNGIGAKAAISILSSMDINRLLAAIATGDADTITKAQGIGKKTAQRVVLELKDKVDSSAAVPGAVHISGDDNLKMEAMNALINLGYAKSEALNALAGLECGSTEEYIKKALKNLF